MSITFHYLSGSPFSWKVWLALEHKELSYTLNVLKADAGDLKQSQYLAINPHGKAPALEVDGFSLYESSVIIEFLEDSFPNHGLALWPHDPRRKAIARRLAAEVDAYLYPPVRCCVEQLLLSKESPSNGTEITQARQAISSSLALFDGALVAPFLMGTQATAADFALYPMTSMLTRLDLHHPAHGFAALMSERLKQWRSQVEALPFFRHTEPPHWRTSTV